MCLLMFTLKSGCCACVVVAERNSTEQRLLFDPWNYHRIYLWVFDDIPPTYACCVFGVFLRWWWWYCGTCATHFYFVYTLTISINFSPQKDCPTKARMRTTSVPFPSERLLMKTHILRTSLCVHALIHRAKANTGKTNGIIILGKKPLFGVCGFNTHPHTTSSSRCFFRCPV